MDVLIEACRNEWTAFGKKCLEESFRCFQLLTLRSVVVTVLASMFLTLTFRFSTAPWTLVIAFATVTGGFPCWLGCYIINFQSGFTVDSDLKMTYILSRLRSSTLGSASTLRSVILLWSLKSETFLCLTHCKFCLKTLSPLTFGWIDYYLFSTPCLSWYLLKLSNLVSVNWLGLLLLHLISSLSLEDGSTLIFDFLGHLLRIEISFIALRLALLIRSFFA